MTSKKIWLEFAALNVVILKLEDSKEVLLVSWQQDLEEAFADLEYLKIWKSHQSKFFKSEACQHMGEPVQQVRSRVDAVINAATPSTLQIRHTPRVACSDW